MGVRISGAAFTAELGFKTLELRFPGDRKIRRVEMSNVRTPEILSDGSIKIRVRLGRDIIVPTSRSESIELTKALNALLSERKSAGLRRRQIAKQTLRENARQAARHGKKAGQLNSQARGYPPYRP